MIATAQVLPPETIAKWTKDTAAPYHCKDCGYTTDNPLALRAHWTRKHGNNRGATVGRTRPAAAVADANLAKWTADTAPPFHCRECSYTTNIANGLCMHFSRKHGNNQGPTPATRGKGAVVRSRKQIALRATGDLTRLADLRAEDAPEEKHHRVYWTKEEQAQIVNLLVAHFRDDPTPWLTVKSINKAQHLALPKERWRHLAGPSQCTGIWAAAGDAFIEIVTKATMPPVERVREVFREVPYDLHSVLHDCPLHILAGIYHEREMKLRLASYSGASHSTNGDHEPEPKLTPKETLVVDGTDEAHITALLPRVQVVGFRTYQHKAMAERFIGEPVIFLPSIDPSTPPDAALIIPTATKVYVEKSAATDAWKRLVIGIMPADRREGLHGPHRVLDYIKDLAHDWRQRHRPEFSAWQRLKGPKPTI